MTPLLEKAQHYFDTMTDPYDVEPARMMAGFAAEQIHQSQKALKEIIDRYHQSRGRDGDEGWSVCYDRVCIAIAKPPPVDSENKSLAPLDTVSGLM